MNIQTKIYLIFTGVLFLKLIVTLFAIFKENNKKDKDRLFLSLQGSLSSLIVLGLYFLLISLIK
jgi:hypothetical protein